MRQVWNQSELDVASSKMQRSRWYLAIHKPRVIGEFVNDTNFSSAHPLDSLPIDPPYPDGASDVKAGMTVWFGSTQGGSDLGRARIVEDWDDTGNLYFMESGSGLFRWNDVLYMTVVEEFRPWVRHPTFPAVAWEMDNAYIQYTDQLETYPPLAVMGAPFVKILDGAGTATGSFVGEHSVSWDDSITEWLWEFPDGDTSSSEGTEAAPVSKEFSGASPGGSYVSLTVTTAGGRTHTGRRLCFAFDDISSLPRVAFTAIQGGTVAGGYRAQIQAYNLNDDDLPPGTEIIIFESASYGSTASELGGNSPYRNNIVFRGWLTDEQIQKTPETGLVVLSAETINGIMNKAPSYDVFYAYKPSGVPSGSQWVATTKILTPDRVAFNLMRWRSTVGDIVDFFPASKLAISFPMLYQNLPRDNWWNQLKTNYYDRGLLYGVAADMQSNIFAYSDPNITGGSASEFETFPVLTASNIGGTVSIERSHFDATAQVQLYAVSIAQPLGAESPGNVMGYFGGKVERAEGLSIDTQQRLIDWAGNLREKNNAEFKRVAFPLAGNLRIDPVPNMIVPVTVSTEKHGKRIDWEGKSFIPFELQLNYETGGIPLATIVAEEVVNGKGGSSITFPTIIPVEPPPSPDPAPPPGPVVDGTGDGTVYVMGEYFLGRTRNFSSQYPTWNTENIGPTSDIYYDFILDPWNPTNGAYLTTDSGVYKTTNLDSSSPSWTLVASAATIISSAGGYWNPYKISASINVQNYVAIFFEGTSGALYCMYSTDGGTSWSYSQIDAQSENIQFGGGADYVPHIVNGGIMLYAIGGEYSGSPPQYRPKCFRSTDGGATWSARGAVGNLLSGWGFAIAYACHCPYDGNEAGNIVYIAAAGSTWKSTDGGMTWTSLGIIPEANVTRHAIETHTENNNIAYIWSQDLTVRVSTDAAASFQTRGTVPGTQIKAAGGFPFDSGKYYVVSNTGVYYSNDGGNSFQDKTNNFPTDALSGMATNDRAIIVPLWIE
jgi:hypothetical protein